MIALLKDVATAVAKFPEHIPLLWTLIKTHAGSGAKDEKLIRGRRAVIAAGGRQALYEALPGDK